MADSITERGFLMYTQFTDRYGFEFSVQESSLATERCVWVGRNSARGHLNEEQARAVRDRLNEFLGEADSD